MSAFDFSRLIGPLFSDGLTSPRISNKGGNLPLARVVSSTMHPDENKHEHAATVMLVAWGQFMDHDFTLTATPLGKKCLEYVGTKKSKDIFFLGI